MKTLTVSLLVCTMMALIQAFLTAPQGQKPKKRVVQTVFAVLPDKHHEYSAETDTQTRQPAPTEDLFGGWSPWCPNGWSMHNQQCLLFVPTNLTWKEANENCRSRRGQLASVYNDLQAEEIHKEMQRAGYNHGQFWVGGHNTPENPSWSWSDYNHVSAFAHFCFGNTAKHEHHCLQITFGEGMGGCLDAMKCETKLPSVCGYIIM